MGCPIALDTSQWRYHPPSLSCLISGGGLLDSLDSLVRLFRFFYGRPRHGMYGGNDGATPVSHRRNWLGGWPGRREDGKTRSNQELGREAARVCFTIACALAEDNSRVSSGGSTAATSIPDSMLRLLLYSLHFSCGNQRTFLQHFPSDR